MASGNVSEILHLNMNLLFLVLPVKFLLLDASSMNIYDVLKEFWQHIG